MGLVAYISFALFFLWTCPAARESIYAYASDMRTLAGMVDRLRLRLEALRLVLAHTLSCRKRGASDAKVYEH